VLARALARRGEIFDQNKVLIRESPATYDHLDERWATPITTPA
jgi:hypothetical protein